MKAFKKILSAVLAASMALAMMVGASAEGTATGTIKTATDDTHTYSVYQIFTGDLVDGQLNNVKWGQNGTGTEGTYVDASVTNEIAALKTSANGYADDVAALAVIEKYADLTGTAVGTVTKDQSLTVTPGYYLIKDASAVTGTDASTLYIVQVVGDVTIARKTGIPTVEKKVQDTNDTTGETTGWQDSADYDIGDTIPYQITATMGDLSAYNHYYVEFTDTMSAGLTYQAITSVKVGDTTLTADQYTATWKDQVLTVVINDVIARGATTGTKVVVEYTATLNDKAVIGSEGNPNTVYLTFTNNPNNTGDGTKKPDETGNTPTDKNIVFTYKVVANKIDGNNQPLSGAKFELFKKNAKGAYNSLGEIEQTAVKNDKDEVTGYTFTWNGIDDGDYKIVETQTPAGYNTIDPIEFTVSAEHDVLSDNPTLTKLNGTNGFTGEVSTGAVSANITNYTGATLPTTGGMGTTMFYIAGGIMVAAAGILLITKKRMAH